MKIKRLYLLLECGHIRTAWSRRILDFYRCSTCGIKMVAIDGKERNKKNDELLFWEPIPNASIDKLNLNRLFTCHDLMTDGLILNVDGWQNSKINIILSTNHSPWPAPQMV